MIRGNPSAFLPSGARMGGNRWGKPTQRRRRRRPTFIPLNFGDSTKTYVTRNMKFRSRSGSMTQTMQGKRGYKSVKIAPEKGSTASYYSARQRPHPKANMIRRIGTPQYYQLAYSSRLTGNTGQQGYTSASTAVSADLNNMVTQVTGYNNTTNIILEHIAVDTVFSNMSEATVYIDLYECVPRYNVGTVNYNSGTAANSGIIDASGSTANFSALGIYPTMSPQFTTFWKIYKKYTFELAQGMSHCHKAYYKVGQKWNQELYNVIGSGNYISNFSKSLLVVAYGAPINDQTTKTNVSTASVAVDIVRKERFTWYYNNPTNTLFKYTSALPAITTEYLLDIGSGEPETLNAA